MSSRATAERDLAAPASWVVRAARAGGVELTLALAGLVAIAVHIADDNYLQPRPGTSPADHLASGLVPIAILLGVGVALPRLRTWLRAPVAMTFGALGIAIGFPGAYYLRHGSAEGSHFSGPVALAGGVVLLVAGGVMLWRARRRDGSRARRLGRVALKALAVVPVGLALLLFVVFPVGFSYGYTHVGRTGPPPDLGVPYEAVTVTTSDSLELSARYVPSRNRAAVVVYPGSSAVAEARMLARNGYGVLLLAPRGQDGSEGDLVRWAGDRDLNAGAEYLRSRPDVDADRIGGFGSSVGGEMLLVAAAQTTLFKAVVSEGAGFPIGDADLSGVEGALARPIQLVMRGAGTVFANHGPPARIRDTIGRIAPRSVFLIYAEPGMGGEDVRQPKYFAAAGEPKSIWKVAGAEHTGGIDAQPAEYERRVVGFFDEALQR